MVNFYHGSIPRAAHLMRQLNGAVVHVVTWSEDMLKAFLDTKAALAAATMPAHPVPEASVALTTDA